MESSVKQLTQELAELQLEVDALQQSVWDNRDKLSELRKNGDATMSAVPGVNTQAGAGDPPASEPSQQEMELIKQTAAMEAELTVRQMKLQALKKRLADAIANESEFFKGEESNQNQQEEAENAND